MSSRGQLPVGLSADSNSIQFNSLAAYSAVRRDTTETVASHTHGQSSSACSRRLVYSLGQAIKLRKLAATFYFLVLLRTLVGFSSKLLLAVFFLAVGLFSCVVRLRKAATDVPGKG